MDYKIEKKDAFTVLGHVRQFDSNTSYEQIPKFWDEHFTKGGGDNHENNAFG